MPMPRFGITQRLCTLALVISTFAIGSLAFAEPSLLPYEYHTPPVPEADDDPASSEPDLAAAMPATSDPVQRIMHSVVTVEVVAREDARTESTFGSDRKGTGVIIDSGGLIATVGYLVAEAESVKVTFTNGITDQADIVAYDDSLGIGLLRPKNFRSTYSLVLGSSSDIEKDQKALILPAGGEEDAVSVTIGKVKPFTGGWEYMLDDAIHTYPPSADFSGAALLSEDAKLLGIGALVSIDIDIDPKVRVPGNIFVPIDALKNVLGELLTSGRSKSSVKPWLGLETKNTKSGIKVGAVYEDAPAANSGIKVGDSIVAVNQVQVSNLKELYSKIWSEHKPGDKIHLLVLRDDQYANVAVETVDRYEWLKLQDSQPDEETKITEVVE